MTNVHDVARMQVIADMRHLALGFHRFNRDSNDSGYLPGLAPCTRETACSKPAVALFDAGGGESLTQGNGAPVPLRLFVDIMLCLPPEIRRRVGHQRMFATLRQLRDAIWPNGWQRGPRLSQAGSRHGQPDHLWCAVGRGLLASRHRAQHTCRPGRCGNLRCGAAAGKRTWSAGKSSVRPSTRPHLRAGFPIVPEPHWVLGSVRYLQWPPDRSPPFGRSSATRQDTWSTHEGRS